MFDEVNDNTSSIKLQPENSTVIMISISFVWHMLEFDSHLMAL